MCISYSVMEGQRHNNLMLLFTTAQNALTHAIVEAAKALGGSFKLAMLAPKTVSEINCSGKHKRMGTYKQIKKHK